jgi:dTMP kinase
VTRGSLVVFEGLDGSGKSTQLPRLAARLRARGYEVLETREPYDSAPGRRIRELARSHAAVAPEAELALFLEQRRLHVQERIAPALARGEVVLSDRYFLSTVAYQGARGLDPAALLAANEAEFPLPDLALLLELPPAAGLARVAARGAPSEPAFEHAELLARVAAIFAALERPYLERIDATGTPEAVEARIAAAVSRRLGLL